MKLKAVLEIELPNDADPLTIECAKLTAEQFINWEIVRERKDRMARTNLDNKCGSCKFFELKPDMFSQCYGKCHAGHYGYKQRSVPACKDYERKPNEQELRSNYSP